VFLVSLDPARGVDMAFRQKPSARSPCKAFRYDGKEAVRGERAILVFRVQRRDLCSRESLSLHAAICLAKTLESDLVSFGRARPACIRDMFSYECIDEGADR
jgi:hypothetical protein